jgi:uncharacterized membrane protein
VNDRLHALFKAVVLTLVIGVIFTALSIYTSHIGQLLNTTVIWTILWIMLGFGAIVLPFY